MNICVCFVPKDSQVAGAGLGLLANEESRSSFFHILSQIENESNVKWKCIDYSWSMQKGRESRLNGERERTKKESALLATFAKVKERIVLFTKKKTTKKLHGECQLSFGDAGLEWKYKKGKEKVRFFLIIIFWALDIWQNFKDRNKNKRSQKKHDERSLAYFLSYNYTNKSVHL